MTKISDEDLAELIQTARQHRGGKATKYTSLELYRESIVELMRNDIQLPLILDWLNKKHGVDVVLNTLRKYIVKRIGREAYDDYLDRNGWKKTRRTPQEASPPQPVVAEGQNAKAGVRFDLNIPRPATFNRTKRD